MVCLHVTFDVPVESEAAAAEIDENNLQLFLDEVLDDSDAVEESGT
jgi:hypothetical protein